jgi:hypothetical protein
VAAVSARKQPGSQALPNGMPEWKPYRWRDPDAGRAAQVEAILARIRADIALEKADEPGPDDMGYEWRREQLAELTDPPAREPDAECPICNWPVFRCSCPERTAERRRLLAEGVRGWRKP